MNAGYRETAVGDPFVTFTVLPFQEMLVGAKVDGFLTGIPFSEDFIEERMYQRPAVIEYCPKNIIIR